LINYGLPSSPRSRSGRLFLALLASLFAPFRGRGALESTPDVPEIHPEVRRQVSNSAGPSSAARTIATNSAWLTVEFVLNTIGGLAASIAIAHVLGPVKVGYYSYLLWAVSSAAIAAKLGIPSAARKYAAEYLGAGQTGVALAILDRAWRAQRAIALVLGLGGLAVVFLFIGAEQRPYALVAALCLAPTLLMEIPTAGAAAVQQYRVTVVPSIIASTLNLVGVALALIFRWDLTGLAISLLIARVLDLALRRYSLGRVTAGLRRSSADSVSDTIDRQLESRMRRFCVGAAAVEMLNLVVWDRSEIFFLGRYCDIREVAFYSIPFNIINQVLLITRSFTSSASSHLMTKIGSDVQAAKDLTTTLLRYLAMMAFPLLLGLAALSRPLVQVVYGSAFHPAARILAILAVFSIVRAALTLVLLLFSAFDIQGLAVRVMAACAVFNLLLDLLLIPKYGALGAAVASAIAQCAGISLLWFVLASKMRLRLGWRRLLPIAAAGIGAVIPAAVLAVVWPPWPALLGGTLAGAVLYAPLMRIAGAVKKSDREHFGSLVPLIPVRLQRAATRLMNWLIEGAP